PRRAVRLGAPGLETPGRDLGRAELDRGAVRPPAALGAATGVARDARHARARALASRPQRPCLRAVAGRHGLPAFIRRPDRRQAAVRNPLRQPLPAGDAPEQAEQTPPLPPLGRPTARPPSL